MKIRRTALYVEVYMKYAVIVIFKNGMKLDKTYERWERARDVASNLSKYLYCDNKAAYFANTHFMGKDVLCVTWQEVKEDGKS